jgi:hypothetical protein
MAVVDRLDVAELSAADHTLFDHLVKRTTAATSIQAKFVGEGLRGLAACSFLEQELTDDLFGGES